MPEKNLNEILKELHNDLAGADRVDDETREQLKTLLQDIQRVLADCETQDNAMEPVINDLQSIFLRLETDHPYTAGLLSRLASSLANLGI